MEIIPNVNMALLSALAEMIASVRSAMDKVGAVTINVSGYGNNIDWKQSEAPAAGDNEESEDGA